MATIVTRAGKGSPLTHVEVDANFTNLNTDKAESTNASIATSINLTGAALTWTFSLSGNDLVISYGATSVAKIDTSGNLTVIGDVTAFGAI